jgi:hypothetical protein
VPENLFSASRFEGLSLPPLPLLRFFLQRDGELGLAGSGGIVEGFASAVAFGGVERHAALDAIGETGEAGFAIDIGAEFEVEFVKTSESVGDVHAYFRGVDRSAGIVGDSEVGGAGSGSAIKHGDGFGVGSGSLGEGGDRQGEREKSQRCGKLSEFFPRNTHTFKITLVVNGMHAREDLRA